MNAAQKQDLYYKAADKLKLASHFAEAYRKDHHHTLEQASTVWRLTGEANAAMQAYHAAMLGNEPMAERNNES